MTKKKELVGYVHYNWLSWFCFSTGVLDFPLIRDSKTSWFDRQVKITIDSKKITIEEI